MIDFELICVSGMRYEVYLFAYYYPILPVPYVEMIIHSPVKYLCTSIKDYWTIYVWIYFWALCSIYLLFHLYTNITNGLNTILCNKSWNWVVYILQLSLLLVLLFTKLLWLFLGVSIQILNFCINFRIRISISRGKNPNGVLIMIS